MLTVVLIFRGSDNERFITNSGGFRGGRTRRLPPFFRSPNLCTYLLTAIRASFGKKLRTQEEPKFSPPDSFSWLQICQNCFCGRGAGPGAYSAPLYSLTGLRGPTSKRRRGEGRGGRSWGKSREAELGRGREGKVAPPFSNSWIRPWQTVRDWSRIAMSVSAVVQAFSLRTA